MQFNTGDDTGTVHMTICYVDSISPFKELQFWPCDPEVNVW